MIDNEYNFCNESATSTTISLTSIFFEINSNNDNISKSVEILQENDTSNIYDSIKKNSKKSIENETIATQRLIYAKQLKLRNEYLKTKIRFKKLNNDILLVKVAKIVTSFEISIQDMWFQCWYFEIKMLKTQIYKTRVFQITWIVWNKIWKIDCFWFSRFEFLQIFATHSRKLKVIFNRHWISFDRWLLSWKVDVRRSL